MSTTYPVQRRSATREKGREMGEVDPEDHAEEPGFLAGDFSFSRMGDTINLLVVVNTLAYLLFFVLNHASKVSSMDPATKVVGFCVSNPTSGVWNSHTLSFFVDVIMSAITILVVYTAKQETEALDFLRRSIPGTFGHGLGHAFLSRQSMRAAAGIDGDAAVMFTSIASMSWPEYLAVVAVIHFFWFSLLRTNKYTPISHLCFHSVVHSYVLMSGTMPVQAGFTYVQTVLVLTFTFYDVFFRPKSAKTLAYDYSGFVSVPFSVVAWLEGLACSNFLVNIGGHVWYDFSIPSALLVYYFVVSSIEVGRATPKK